MIEKTADGYEEVQEVRVKFSIEELDREIEREERILESKQIEVDVLKKKKADALKLK